MRLLFLGDSLTEGVGATTSENSYVKLVEKALSCQVFNYGISGTRIAKQTNPTCYATRWDLDFQLRAQTMPEDADLVFVLGGINDFQHGDALLGEVSSEDPYTFCGGVRNLLTYLVEKYGKEKLCLLLPPRLCHEQGRPCKGPDGAQPGADYEVYVEHLNTIAQEYVPNIIDLYHNGYPKPLCDTVDIYTVDGIHPSDEGYRVIAENVCLFCRERMHL